GHYVVCGAPADPVAAALCRSLYELEPVLSTLKDGHDVLRERVASIILDGVKDLQADDDLRGALARMLTPRRLPSPPQPDAPLPPRPTAAALSRATLSQQVAATPTWGSWVRDQPWECLGPYNVSGCVKQLAVCPDVRTRIYAACDGG